MNQEVTKTRKRVRTNMLRQSADLFKHDNKNKLTWLAKLQAELDLDVVEIVTNHQ
ncbi:MAG: hypothetical protein ACM3PX_09755 [Omnitrophica WOR_2 bacterium]|jgi:hypothetical protein